MASPSRRISGLDGLRAVSIGIVLVSHYAPAVFPSHPALARAVPGMFGVYVFFVISGFLICTLLLEEFEKSASISLKNFYLRRFLRLQPALFVYVIVSLVAFLILDSKVDLWWFLSAATYTSNYYASATQTIGNGYYDMPVWSLAVEEHFYLVFPALLLLLLRRSAKIALWSLAGITMLVLLWRVVLVSAGAASFDQIYHNSDTRFDAPLFGVILAMAIRFFPNSLLTRSVRSIVAPIVAMIFLALSVMVRDETFRMTFRYTLQGIGILLIVGYLMLSGSRLATFFRNALDAPVPKFLGKISYPLYLWHLTLLMIVMRAYPALPPMGAVVIGFASIGVASLSYYFVERRFLGLRHRFGSHSTI